LSIHQLTKLKLFCRFAVAGIATNCFAVTGAVQLQEGKRRAGAAKCRRRQEA
jgi:hypothetical protein